MFRISQFMHDLARAEATGVYPQPARRGGMNAARPSGRAELKIDSAAWAV